MLTFKDDPDFESPVDAGSNNSYVVEVTATGGTGGRALTAEQTITVTDENEPPQTPAAPDVTALSPTILRVNWTEPTNNGPGITDYDVQYRQGTSGAFTDVNYNGTGTTTTLIGLNPNTMYQVQVLARNDEGMSEWSQSGEGRTNTTGPPGKPDPPTLTAPYSLTLRIQWTAPYSLTLRIQWTAPENSGSTPITGYKLQYGKDGGQLEEYFRVFTDTETTFRSQPPGTDFEIQVRAINNDGTGEWSNSAFGSVQPNKLPTFDEASPVRSYAENTVAGQNIGEPLFVTDDYIGHVGIAFSLEGTDAENFNIVKVLGRRGQLQTKEGVTYDYETNNVYSVTVKAVDPQGGSATVDATIELTDVDEPPNKPGTPKVEASTLTSLTLIWTAPDNTGKPAISSYDVRYRIGIGTFTIVNYDGTDTRATVGSLNANTDYELQVRARNDEGEGKWSDPVNGTPSDNQPPVFSGDGRFEVAENEATVSTVVATDADNQDSVTGYEISGGADEAQFEITSGNTVAFKTAPDFERPADVASTQPSSAAGDNEYIVEVTATSGIGDRVETTVLPIIVTVTNLLEPPGKIDMPTPSALGGPRNLTVEWSVPENTGPDIALYGYEVQHRIADSGDAFANGHLTWGTSAPNSKKAVVQYLNNNTSYELQVRAINDEGAGEWSDSATGTTFNEPPTVTALDDRALTVGGGAEIIRLIDGFNDTQHGIAWYAAASNNNAVATVQVAGDHLTIRPVAVGNTSVEITAHDEYGLSATQTIDVSVQAATLPNPVVAFDTDDEDLTIQFTDRFEAEETRAYDVRVRQQNPLGLVGQTRAAGKSSWVTGCVEQSNPDTSAADISIMASLEVDLDAGTAYEVDYRYRGEPCSVRDYSPGLWSRKVEYTASGTSSFDIEFVFKDFTPTAAKKALFDAAEERWESIIKNSLPDYSVSGEVVDDLRIEVELSSLFAGAASASVRNRRLETRLPAVSRIKIDETYYNSLSDDLFKSIILHEMAHALGFSANAVVWRHYLRDRSDYDQTGDEIPAPHFLGLLAISAFNAAGGADYAGAKVPVEDGSTRLTSASDRHHWRESVLRDELMTPIAESALISAITIQAMADIGYVVDVTQADTYTLPTPSSSKIAKTSVQQVPLECVPGHSVETEMFEVPDAFSGVLESTILKIRVIGER